MDAVQVQGYIDQLIAKQPILGEHYVARQLEWAVVELELAGETHRYEVAEVEDERCYQCGGTGERDGEECPFCRGSGFQADVPSYEAQV